MLRSIPLFEFFSIHLLSVVLAVSIGLTAFPHQSWAQQPEIEVPPNFCTLLQESPRTEDARSSVQDEWNEGDESWESRSRIVQHFNGGALLDSLTIQELDAGTWRDPARATPQYDSSDRVTLCTVEGKESDGFVNSLRQDLRYNSDGRLDSLLVEAWDSDSEEWVNSLLSRFEYDDSGNDTLQVDQVWNPNSETWINNQRFLRTYDSQDRIEEELQESWDIPAQDWENESRSQFTYMTDEREVVDQTWDGSDWVDDARRTTSLDNNGLPESTLTEDWDGSNWVNDAQSNVFYTTDGGTEKFERIVNENWDDGNDEWVNDNRTRFSYNSVIPVELARFEAQRSGEGTVRLTWQTASETNNSGFAVQRRVSDASAPGASQVSSGASWSTVQFVEGAGTTSEPQFYQFTDQTVPYAAETVRYRLKQVDLDGSTDLSDVVKVRLGAPERLALQAPFPNPSQNQATVRYEVPERFQDTEVQVAVYDLLGRRVATPVDGRKSAGRAQIQLRTQDLPSGTYILRLQAADQTRTQRLTIVK